MASPSTYEKTYDSAEQSSSSSSSSPFPERLRGKRILLATESLGPVNGVSRTTGSLIQYLKDNDVQVAIVAPEYKGRKSGKYHNNTGPELRIHGWPLPYSPDLAVAYPFRLDNICRRTLEPDLIYLASPASVGFQFLLQIRQLETPPVVCLNFQTDLSAYSQILLPHPLDDYAVWMLRGVQGYLFKHWAVDTIFYPSKPVHSYLTAAGAPQSKLMHLGRGVDAELFNPNKRSVSFRERIAPNGELIFVCVGRLAPEKGFNFLAKALSRLGDNKSCPDFKMLIVGGNKNASVEKKVHSLFSIDPNLRSRVHFLGFQTGPALAEIYASADLFLHCSVTETFGLVVLEAMASGVPVIARDAGGPSEIVVHDETGYLVPPDDLDGFVNAVEMLARDEDLRGRFAACSRARACEATWDRINNRVAWQLLRAIEKHADAANGADVGGGAVSGGGNDVSAGAGTNTPIRNWVKRHPIATISSATVMMRLNAAVALVCVFWIVAVLPLLVHGNSALPLLLSDRIRKASNWSAVGTRFSDWLRFKNP